MNNKLIVFLLNKELFEIDKYRYEFDNFDLPNIKYEIHDLQEVINKKKIFDKDLNTIQNKNLKKFNDYNEWKKYIDTLFTKYGKNDLAFKNQIIPTNLNSFLINYFIKKKIKTNVIENTLKNSPIQKRNNKINYFIRSIFHFFKNPKKIIIYFNHYFFQFLSRVFNLQPSFYLRFGTKSEKFIDNKVINGNSFDYNIHLVTRSFKSSNYIKGDYALFLESPTPIFTGDVNLEGVNKNDKMTVKGWTNSLNNFFSFLEENLKLEVLISPHPKAKHESYTPPYYFGRKISKDLLSVSSRNAKLIITRASIGISFGIINSVPVSFITSNEIKKNRYNHMIWQEFFANSIGKTLINIDDYSERQVVNQIFEIDKNKYSEYKKNYLTLRNDNKKNSELIKEKLTW